MALASAWCHEERQPKNKVASGTKPSATTTSRQSIVEVPWRPKSECEWNYMIGFRSWRLHVSVDTVVMRRLTKTRNERVELIMEKHAM